MKSTLGVIAACLIGSAATAADMSSDEFLRQAVRDATIPSDGVANAGVGGLNRWLNDLQLRGTEDPDKHGYALRLSPKMPRQIAAEKSIMKLHREQREVASLSDLNDRLKLQYERWLNLQELRDRVSATERAQTQADAEVLFQRSLAQTTDFQPRALLEAELSLAQYAEAVRMQRGRLSAAQAELAISVPARGLIAMDELLRTIAVTAEDVPSIGERADALALELANQKVRAERARQGLALDLMQVEMATDETTRTRTVGFLVGLRLPLGGASFSSAERQYELFSARTDLRHRTTISRSTAAELRDVLAWHGSEVEALDRTLAALDERQQRARTNGDVAVLLALQREQIKTNERRTDVRYRALRTYLDLLHLNGQLAAPPLRNWLLPGLQPL